MPGHRAEKPRRSVIFLGFDLEEIGLFGSRYFVEHSPVPLDRIKLLLVADMIGRSLGGVCEPYAFVLGSEHAPALPPLIAESARGRDLTVGILGADLLVIDRSDYGPFRARGVPFLFFSTGENPRYHTPDDTADSLNVPKCTEISRLIFGILARAADAPALPPWSAVADNPLAEAVTVRDVMREMLANRAKLKIGLPNVILMRNVLGTLDVVIARGSITPAERSAMAKVASLVLASIF